MGSLDASCTLDTSTPVTVTGGVTLKGDYNASTNSPDLDSSPISCIKKGDQYVVSVAGSFFTEAIQAGDSIISKQDCPTLLTHWIRVENNITGSVAVLGANTFTASQDIGGNDIDNIQNLIHDTSTTTTALDLSGDQLQTISISADTTFTTSNRATGKSKTIKITTDGSTRTLTFPAWKFVGAKPSDQAASKIGILTISCFGSADSDIVAAYAVEE